MPDVVDAGTRSRMMSGIRGKNTKPEFAVRSGLHRLGFRFRLHVRDLPGRPDLVLPRYRAVVFVHGCFWHGHECHLFRWPETRGEFWRSKIMQNRLRDERQIGLLRAAGWRVGVVWECAIRERNRVPQLCQQIAGWIESDRPALELRA